MAGRGEEEGCRVGLEGGDFGELPALDEGLTLEVIDDLGLRPRKFHDDAKRFILVRMVTYAANQHLKVCAGINNKYFLKLILKSRCGRSD